MSDDMFCVELDKHLQDSDDELDFQEDKLLEGLDLDTDDEFDQENEKEFEVSECSSDDDLEFENDKALESENDKAVKSLSSKYKIVTYSVSCEYRVEPVKSKYRREVKFSRNKNFIKTFNSTSTEIASSVSGGKKMFFSVSAGFATARKRIAEATFDNETVSKEEISEGVEFFDGHKQVYRVVKQTMNINGERAIIETKDLVDATTEPLSWDERKERAVKVRSKTETYQYLKEFARSIFLDHAVDTSILTCWLIPDKRKLNRQTLI